MQETTDDILNISTYVCCEFCREVVAAYFDCPACGTKSSKDTACSFYNNDYQNITELRCRVCDTEFTQTDKFNDKGDQIWVIFQVNYPALKGQA